MAVVDPFIPLREGLWDELVSTCLGEQVAIDRDELVRWLAYSGWGPEVVTVIAGRFFADSEWLAERLEVTTP